MPTHIVIPDTQVKNGVPTYHLRWIGRYIVDQFKNQPDVTIIHIGDHWDMPSLSAYDKGKKAMEGRRYALDIEAGNDGFDLLNEPLNDFNRKQRKHGRPEWIPRKVFTLGNHENRITRATEDNAQLDGVVSLDDLNAEGHGWEVIPFLEPIFVDSVAYCHYWYNPNTGRPYGGLVDTRLKQIGHSFTMGHQQGLQYSLRTVAKKTQHGLVAGSCLTPDHRVLTADLRYIPMGDLTVGQTLVSFDEEVSDSLGRSRRYKKGTVLAVRTTPAEVFAVTLSNGKVFRTTADHRWLVKTGGTYRWTTTAKLQSSAGARLGTRVVRVLDEWETDTSYDAGYIAGIYDGEGCLYTRRSGNQTCGQLSFSQKPGLVLDQTKSILGDRFGIESMTLTNQRGVCALRLKGGLPAIAKMLGSIRPVRLLDKFTPEHLGSMTTMSVDNPTVESVVPVGVQDVVQVDVDAKTMIVDGYAHHNCYLHEEVYLGPQGNHPWTGIVVCHEVRDGSYDPMFVSLDYLCRRYTGISLSAYRSTGIPTNDDR